MARDSRARRSTRFAVFAFVAAAAGALAAEPEGPSRLQAPRGEIGRDLIGEDDTLLDVALRNRVGFEALARLNPGLDTWLPTPGSVAVLPTRYLLPEAEPEGLVLNIPEMRLFDFRVDDGPEVFAVAVGDPEVPTPVGDFAIGAKREDPVWNVPASIRAEKPELPARVPPGPENPLGSRWLTIGRSSYGLHGTNVRWSIGRRSTHGCVRLYEDQVIRLYDRTPPGTRLQIVYQPFKWGREGRRLYLEVHPDLYARIPDPLAAALALPRELGLLDALDLERVWQEVEAASGIPVAVGTLPTAPEPG